MRTRFHVVQKNKYCLIFLITNTLQATITLYQLLKKQYTDDMLPELKVFLAAMTPLDLKLAIPLGLNLGLSSVSTFLFATFGTIVPAAIILAVTDPVIKWLRLRHPKLDKFFDKLFHKTRKEHSKKFARYGALFLFAIIALPLPGGGANMGAFIAFLFGVDYWKAFTLIVVGTAACAMLILGGVGSVIAISNYF